MDEPINLKMLKNIFEKYGSIYLYPTKYKENYKWNMSIDLDAYSFDFLLREKKFSFKDNIIFIHFLAGIIDSDGSIYVRKAGKYIQYIIRIFGENLDLLREMKRSLDIMNINSILYLSSKKDEVRHNKRASFIYNKDYYILEICRKKDIIKLLNILPIRHPEKIRRKEIILDMLNNGIIFPKDARDMKRLIDEIKRDTKEYVKEAKLKYINKQWPIL